jgi:archaemetzincin
MKRLLLLVLAVIVCATPARAISNAKPLVALRPLGAVDARVVATVSAAIERLYDADVVVLDSMEMPSGAYVAARDRYRAERLLEALDEAADARFAKVVGLTAHDISTSTERHADWGIFGLGAIDARPCVVSTFRLARGRSGKDRVLERVTKVVNHELGHTFGLEHCPIVGCLMHEGSGSVAAIDREPGEFCDACSRRLGDSLKAQP